MGSTATQKDWADRRVMMVIDGLVTEAWSVIEPNLAGLSDEEYLWEPVEGCWSIRPRSSIQGADYWGAGEWVVETSFDGSAAPSTTTIAWRLLHAYDCFADYADQAFGHEPRDWNEIEIPPDATTAVAMMTSAVESLRENLRSSSDDVFLRSSADAGNRPPTRLLNKALLEWIHHCAEIGMIRTFYQHR